MRRIALFILLILLLTSGLIACGGEEEPEENAEATTEVASEETMEEEMIEYQAGLAMVSSVEVGEPAGSSINIIVRGDLPDSCTEIDDITTLLNGDTFLINISTRRPVDAACATALSSFEETVTLDLTSVGDGLYRIDANGQSAEFRQGLPPTNTPAPTSQPTATPEVVATEEPEEAATAEAGDAVIAGRVVHDLCAVADTSDGPLASDGCDEAADGSFIADGQLATDEPGLAGVTVALGEGACPSIGLATAITDDEGAFQFEELTAGAYCVTVDALSSGNELILIPGQWTTPDGDSASTREATITLFESQTIDNVEFGWDYQFLPAPEELIDLPCIDGVGFINDVSIPDDTALAPGEAFVKTWTIINNGTCDWGTDYTVVFADGELMTNDVEFPLPIVVPAGELIEISITMIAPLVEGTYRSDFKMANGDGEQFGVISDDGEDTFWVQIIVEEGATPPEPNSAVISGTIWADDDGDAFYDSFEAGIEGVEVQLSEGTCPADGNVDDGDVLTSAVSDPDGNYRFNGLSGGTYCVSIAAFSSANVELLIPGDWTYPAQGVGLITVIVLEGEQLPFIDFGWQYQ